MWTVIFDFLNVENFRDISISVFSYILRFSSYLPAPSWAVNWHARCFHQCKRMYLIEYCNEKIRHFSVNNYIYKGTRSNTGSSMQFNSSKVYEGADRDNVLSIKIVEYQFYKWNLTTTQIHVLAARALNISGKVPLTDKKLIIQVWDFIIISKFVSKVYFMIYIAFNSDYE